MAIDSMHPAEISAGLKMRYGTVAKFERVKGLPAKSVAEVLRGRSWAKVTAAIEAALTEPIPSNDVSESSDSNEAAEDSHRLIATAR